ncbi:MAG: hypothetical protein ACR2PL_25455 [Dehalococcoidia bacterium]
MAVQEHLGKPRPSPSYTATHRHHLPGHGYTSWSEGVPNGRHSHTIAAPEEGGYIEDSVGSPVHRHAWNYRTSKRTEHGYTSGPLLERAVGSPLTWITRVLRRP